MGGREGVHWSTVTVAGLTCRKLDPILAVHACSRYSLGCCLILYNPRLFSGVSYLIHCAG